MRRISAAQDPDLPANEAQRPACQLTSGLYLFECGPEDKASAEADEFPVALRLQVWTPVPISGWQGPLLYFVAVLRPDAARLTSYQILSAAGMPRRSRRE